MKNNTPINETIKYFCIGSVILLITTFIFLIAETHGKAIESGIGLIGVVIIAALLLITGILMKKKGK